MTQPYRFSLCVLALAASSALLGACNRRDNIDSVAAASAASQADASDTTRMSSATDDTTVADNSRTAPGAAGAGGTGVSTGDASVSGMSAQDRGGHAAATTGDLNTQVEAPAAGLSNQTPLTASEQQFVRTATEAGMFEVAAAKLAMERARDEGVKNMASRLLDDHREANDKLRQIAEGRVSMPTEIPTDKRAVLDRLSKVKAAEFDKQFLQTVGVQDHQNDIRLFEGMQKNVQDKSLKDFVQSTLPTLKHHQEMAEDLRRTLGGKS